MLATLGLQSLDALVEATVPDDIRMRKPLALDPTMGESEALAKLRALHDRNQVFRSYIGMGYYDCITPPVIQRNILENPGWYTQYTPYQAEIAQGRLEALLTYQTMVADLTGLPLANASLLDEATAAAEAMMLCLRIKGDGKKGFFVAQDCHPQTIAVLQTRAQPFGIALHIGPPEAINFQKQDLFGVLLQYPATDGAVRDYSALVAQAHATGAMAVMASMYAVSHGPEGLRRIAERVHGFAAVLAEGLRRMSLKVGPEPAFDTIRVWPAEHSGKRVLALAQERRINLRQFEDGSLGV